jgi:predicted nucleic acid-binding protein
VIVLDASAAVDWLLQTSAGLRIDTRIFAQGDSLHAPHLIDLEVAQVLRRLAREGTITTQRGEQAIQDLQDLRITRYPHFVFLSDIWRLRNNLSAYDAVYVALAKSLGAILMTRDSCFASAASRRIKVELF